MERPRTKREKREIRHKVWTVLRPLVIAVLSICAAIAIVYGGIRYVMVNYIEPVDPSNAMPVEVVIPSGSGASTIAKILYEVGGLDDDGGLIAPGLISNKAVFKVYVDFTGKSSKLKAGTYILSRNMSVSQIVDVICKGNPPRRTVRFTLTEGMSIEDMAAKLVEDGILTSAERFLQICKTGEGITDIALISDIAKEGEGDRFYLLEGYLFPDTYEIYADSTEETIITLMLKRFSAIYTDAFKQRAAELDMSMNEVISLASLIEKEAKPDDFKKVSAVFHNRLSIDMTLGSDAPLKYIFKTVNVIEFTSDQMNVDSPYNTHVYKGLPIGPITNPGQAAIEAALWPNEDYITAEYLYFCLMDGETGALAYAKTYEEHIANVEKYKTNWTQ